MGLEYRLPECKHFMNIFHPVSKIISSFFDHFYHFEFKARF